MHGTGATPAYGEAVVDEEGMDDLERQVRANMQAQAGAKTDLPGGDDDQAALLRSNRIADRETDYQRRRLNRTMTPARVDAYSMGDQTPDASVATYADTLRRAQLNREADNTEHNIRMKEREAEKARGGAAAAPLASATGAAPPARPRRNRWGEAPAAKPAAALADATPAHGLGDATPAAGGFGDATPRVTQRWDATPGPSLGDATPAAHGFGDATPAANRWDATPAPAGSAGGATPKASRWDATPAVGAATPAMTDSTPARKRSRCAAASCTPTMPPPPPCPDPDKPRPRAQVGRDARGAARYERHARVWCHASVRRDAGLRRDARVRRRRDAPGHAHEPDDARAGARAQGAA